MKRKKGKALKFMLALVAVIIFVALAFILGKFSGESSTEMQIVDMNSGVETEYGKMYYSSPEEENIAENNGARYVNNEILITVKEGTSREDVEKLAEKYDCEIVGEIEITGDYQLRLSSEVEYIRIVELIKRFEVEEIVELVSLNYVQQLSASANDGLGDFYYGKKWKSSLKDSDDGKGKSWGFEVINTVGAWQQLIDTEREINPVRVGLIDSGFDVDHDDLGFAQVFYDGGANGVTTRKAAHGSHVAGTMAAKTTDKKGICGVYPYGDGRVYAVATGYESGASTYNVDYMAMKICLAELIVRNVKVINVSMGYNWHEYENFSQWYSETSETNVQIAFTEAVGEFLAEFLQRMLEKGYDFVIVSSAGNDSRDIPTRFDAAKASAYNSISQDEYPDVYNRIIVVGSVDRNLNVAAYSNGGDRVDIYAPGGDRNNANEMIYSCLADNGYGYMSGTSMAAPHVSGVAAMVWSANNSLTGDRVKDIICGSISSRCSSCEMIDANLAVRIALNMTDTGNLTEAHNCGILCYVVDETNESISIEGATVTATNTRTGTEYTETTDFKGHFELMVPAGTYRISVEAEGYLDYTWPGNNADLSDTVTVRNENIKYLDDWIKMSRSPDYDFDEEETQEDINVNVPNSIESEYFDYLEDYGLPLQDMVVWDEYNGHLYVLYDYAMAASVLNYITEINPAVHLVTITDEDEQEFVEELVAQGGREIYYTGGKVDGNGNVYWVTGENAEYTNWYDECPTDYGEEGYDDIVVVYRGYETYAPDDSDFGEWFEVLEDVYSIFDVFDSDLDGITRGIIVEFDEY